MKYDSDCYTIAPRWITLGRITYTWVQDGWGASYRKIFALRKKWKHLIGQECGVFKQGDRVVTKQFMKKYFDAIIQNNYNPEITETLATNSTCVNSDNCEKFIMEHDSLRCNCGDYILFEEADRRCKEIIKLCE